VASAPVDKAGAEFRLARAYLAAGHRDEAEESVLAALEIAPGYAPAQKLLLELHQPSKK
jgi:lipopolysaccharide biosynthesis regulator YciM